MKRSGTIVSYTAEEIKQMIARGEDRSDLARANTMTQEEIEAAIASDPDEAGIVWDASTLTTEIPPPPSKEAISIRLDPDVLEFFKAGGRGYQTKINTVLRAYVDQVRKKAS